MLEACLATERDLELPFVQQPDMGAEGQVAQLHLLLQPDVLLADPESAMVGAATVVLCHTSHSARQPAEPH